MYKPRRPSGHISGTGNALVVHANFGSVRAVDNREVLHRLIAIIGGRKSLITPGSFRRGSVCGDDAAAPVLVLSTITSGPVPEIDSRAYFAGKLEAEFVQEITREYRGQLPHRSVVGVRLSNLVRGGGGGSGSDTEACRESRRSGRIGLERPSEVEPSKETVGVGEPVVQTIDDRL